MPKKAFFFFYMEKKKTNTFRPVHQLPVCSCPGPVSTRLTTRKHSCSQSSLPARMGINPHTYSLPTWHTFFLERWRLSLTVRARGDYFCTTGKG